MNLVITPAEGGGLGQGQGQGQEQGRSASALAFDYRGAYVRLLQALEIAASPSSSEDFMFVLRIWPKIDRDHDDHDHDHRLMLVNDVLVSIDAMIVI